MPNRYRKKPLAQYEHGTRIYAPSQGENRFRVVTTDPSTGDRLFLKLATEDEARAKARELEQFISQAAPVRGKRDEGPRTVDALAQRYFDDHLASLSAHYRQKQSYVLRKWILPRLGSLTVMAWTPADSAAVLTSVRRAGGSDSLVQDVGAAMRSLVTHARRLRWLTSQSEDPMWMVRYSRRASIQGASQLFVPRSSLPTDADCNALFNALESLGHHRWAAGMRLVHRSGLRWGELVALQRDDIEFSPTRRIHVRRSVEHEVGSAPTLKLPKNGKVRTTIFPKSLVADLERLVDAACDQGDQPGLLFPGRNGLVRRSSFQPIWARAADAAGWPMKSPLKRTSAEKNRGWRWTGSAKWSPHDLRHVAACWMLFDVGLDAAVVAEKLGHSDPSFTVKRYVGVRGDPDSAAMKLTDEW